MHVGQQRNRTRIRGLAFPFLSANPHPRCTLFALTQPNPRRPKTHHGISPTQVTAGSESQGFGGNSVVITDGVVRSELSEGTPTAAARSRAEGPGEVYTESKEVGDRRAKLSRVPGTPPIGRAVKGTASLPAGVFCVGFGEDGDGMGAGR